MAPVQLLGSPPDLAALAQWLTQRHDAATKVQGTQLDALYRLLSTTADLQAPSQQVLPGSRLQAASGAWGTQLWRCRTPC